CPFAAAGINTLLIRSGTYHQSRTSRKELPMSTQSVPDHHMQVDLVSSTPKKVLLVVANPTTSTTLGWPVGFWGAELTHPYYERTERWIEVTIASPKGGKVDMDALSDPRDGARTARSSRDRSWWCGASS